MKDQKNKSKNKKKENTKKVESDKDKAYKANKEEQYKKLEAYISESGLTLAFNIIFAELISKQILPENFFAYTSMRLKQIGKEIEDLKTKIIKPEEEKPNNEEEQKLNAENEQPIEKENNSNEKAPIEEDNLFQTQPTKNIPNKKEVDKKNTTLNSKKSTNSKTSSTNKKK